MISISHIVNVFDASDHPDLEVAQPITFESMRAAQKRAEENVKVTLLSAQFIEDRNCVPKGFIATKNLEASTLDTVDLRIKRKLPLISEIIDRAYNECNSDYLIYTNVDIGVQANFYLKVAEFIENDHDAFIINRRRIPERYSDPSQLESIYKEKGKKHPGFDCFVIKRDLIPSFSLADIAIGIPFIGIAMAQNVFCNAKNPKVFEDEFLTFHLGMELFKKRATREYFNYNRMEFQKAMKEIYPKMDSKKWPHGQKSFFERMIRWGLNPSIPILLALRLEPRRWR